MILSRLTAKAQTTVPRSVRAALGLAPGDTLAYRIENGEVRITKLMSADPFVNPYAGFEEWADELDGAYDDL